MHHSTSISVNTGDVKLVADQYGDSADQPVVFLHGGGQTRHSWRSTARDLSDQGWSTYSFDLRGHGESDWAPQGEYSLDAFAQDIVEIVDYLETPPILVGASLGGMSALGALGLHSTLAQGLVLVDVSPFLQPAGTQRIRDFMTKQAHEGFASLEAAADAISAYQPHRPRPKNLDGLRKNLRQRNGRWYWHWDPAFLASPTDHPVQRNRRIDPAQLGAAASRLRVPTLLVRGEKSDVLSTEDSKRFLQLVPHAEFATIAGAHHMIAGDDNAIFEGVLTDFLKRRIRSRIDILHA